MFEKGCKRENHVQKDEKVEVIIRRQTLQVVLLLIFLMVKIMDGKGSTGGNDNLILFLLNWRF